MFKRWTFSCMLSFYVWKEKLKHMIRIKQGWLLYWIGKCFNDFLFSNRYTNLLYINMSMASFLLTRTYLLFPVRQRNVCNGFFFYLIKITLSYNKVATQSHTWGAYYVANNAVDGDIATCMRTDIIGMNDPD